MERGGVALSEADRKKIFDEIKGSYDAQADPRYGAARLWIDALSIPSEHPVTDKGVTKIVNAGPDPPFSWLYAGAPKYPSQHLSSNDG